MSPARSSAAAVRVEDVSMTYVRSNAAALLALDHVSLDIAPASFCSVVGPSGCGKSTLLMLVAGLYTATRGRVLINDQEVRRPWVDVGMVFQRDVLLEWRDVLDNVLLPIEVKRLPKAAHRERAWSLLELVGLVGFADAYPEQLSGGMRQRVAICRALVHDPPLLLMDEPFGALDALTRENLNVDLLRLTAESLKTTIFVTHNIDEAVLMSDQVVVLSAQPGRVRRTFDVDLPKPRGVATRDHPRFPLLVNEIRAEFHSMGII